MMEEETEFDSHASMAAMSVLPLSLSQSLLQNASLRMTPLSPSHGDRFKLYDEHFVAVDELERRFETNRLSGLLTHVVARLQSESPRLNLLPTDVEVGHGSIHELVAVLRDGSWIHTRAENLLPGDVISLKEGQCVPADVRLIECDGMWVDQSSLLGKRQHEPRDASTTSVFDAAEATTPYLEATNMAFYGTVVTKGSGKAIVIRTGEDTVIGGISTRLLEIKRSTNKRLDIPMTESMKQLEVFCKGDSLPSAINRVSALVVEHSDVVKRSIISSSFGVNPPVVIELEDAVLANEMSTDDLEREITLQMMTYSQTDGDARLFTKALAACRHRIDGSTLPSSSSSSGFSSTERVPSLPASSPIAAPVVIDPLRDQNTILRFSAYFGMGSPKNSMYKKTRCSTLLHGHISGCEVYVHFDQDQGAYVVLLQGSAREILSRCGKVRRNDSIVSMETSDLLQIQAMVQDLEMRGQTIVSFAELYLDPSMYPVGVKFDIENFNFPTSNMCYLGSLGLIEKIQPEIMLMGSFARSADVRLLVAATDRMYPREETVSAISEDDDPGIDDKFMDSERTGVKPICRIPIKLREAATGEIADLSASAYRSSALSISNTLGQWEEILLGHQIVIFDACDSSHIDLLVEILQELGDCVGLVASGSANALAIANADVGFSVTSHDFVDLGEEAADVVLASSTCPRSDAIRLIEMAKKVPRRDGSYSQESPNLSKVMSTMTNLFRESISVGRMLGLSENELKSAFENALFEGNSTISSTPAPHKPISTPNPLFLPPSPSKFPANAFRSSQLLSTNPKVGAAALSAGVTGVGHLAATQLSSL
ncbi:hypothetical protein Poli38472_005819 [Pythium oligandrum]|uniref:P-type ATPase A domain-containing protein n=1 Tax=Pythium oligandrum TaxID=41045 RepID=A0A8K1CTJ0_PYTOL|nr:hypothetical protein Poli38472_005819 [Pythium oligandrum]|eukprot:TMW68351.1 hypothetical protein Poli38472_005819 [Pythium oligandrum]